MSLTSSSRIDTHRVTLASLVVMLLWLASTNVRAADADADAAGWPQFRGPGARGIAEAQGLPDRWDTQTNVAWVVDVPGLAWSSPIVYGDRVFVTTAVNENENENETPRKGLYPGGERRKPLDSKHEWVVYCFDAATGKVQWRTVVHEGKPEHPIHIKNTYASETPVTDGERVYAYFGNVGLFALGMNGKPVWERRWPVVTTQANWGTASSPALDGDRLYIVNDNEGQSFLEALDTKTGRTIWKVDRDERSNWSTPFVWHNEKRTEIVTPGTGKVRSYGTDGKLLWELEGMSGITIATPYAVDGLLYVTSGFVLSRAKPVYAIRPGAKGDISLREDALSNDAIAWCQPKAAPYNPSTLVYDGVLYSLLDNGVIAAFDAKTGEEVYDRQRIAATQVTASPWAYGGKIFCLDENGDTYVLRAGKNFETLHKNSLGEMCMATPAIADGRLFLRTISKLYCIAADVNRDESPTDR